MLQVACPFSGKPVNPEAVSEIDGVKVGFCCNNCKGKFEKDPEKSLEKVAKIKAKHVNTLCPVSGKEVDASKTFTHNGEIVAFCCGDCKAKFEKEPAAYAAKVKRDNPSNDKCIVSGEAIDATKFSVYKKVVGFCCGNCQAKFAKEADKLIEKVK